MAIPLQRVTLYKNNLAFVERQGGARAATIAVPKKAKDLVVATLSASCGDSPVLTKFGGAAEADVDEPQPLDFNIGARRDLGEFLSTLIGARVRCSMQDDREIVGAVLLVEESSRAIQGQDAKIESRFSHVHLLTDSGTLERVALETLSNVQILDQKLMEQLIKSIAAKNARRLGVRSDNKAKLAKAAKNTTQISFTTAGESAGDISVSYLEPSKTWRALYRLELDSEDDAGAASKAGDECSSVLPINGPALETVSAVGLPLQGVRSHSGSLRLPGRSPQSEQPVTDLEPAW